MIIPALDLIDSKVVRLYQGNYNQQRKYNKGPLDYLHSYKLQGAEILHLVDLNGARNPIKRQISFLKKLMYNIDLPVQIGGGIRNFDAITTMLDIKNISRVVIGSAAIKHPQEVKIWFKNFGSDSIVLALDVRVDSNNRKEVAINGWQKASSITLEEVIGWYQSVGLKHILCTDIVRDGTLQGANVALYKEISEKFPDIMFQASGGISSLADIAALRYSGVQSVIVGRALLENQFTLSEAIECWQKE
ncbi:1-(5-phosphoribosyl)-5-[(5-phosphoribosylamino)methylideneamino]imidazole-4-carboxamide isomerase [Pantoea sp. Aalb]|uniref:1-(5-phosphoribosyl)-5-[(5- phosphoribosylamino)methylideneamino]imidazole-4- carboxamide isomerase n=1 Tax=Pantoea sp. Aalb TaxID=2576762 RepID=UPI00132776F7|nr:1-(5-phosphoribosyl)-5-[(5-phosphoribosylamino)methylideneamino]imidazole-4-carboxamide isomerase [Pantoea sp. Aalb]MXP67334.1 1-(5-phosphoribosyl)-5-[(5-phosphoribosylamino)methylideneamino]imidazole-4-carboxamide isomerase [Pantoea sp. Aalb]